MNRERSIDTYIPLDLIGSGGMAEVFRCKLVGERGFEKLVVLKKLLPEAACDHELVTNFIDEARLAALLQHENITHIYNFGELDGSYFIAMEYLFGRDLHSIMVRSREQGEPIAPAIALQTILEVCEGMEYAHSLKDLQQRPLNIIHRDLTPHNVFITYDGKVKIIDFGIARAELYDHRTRVGVVKGKVSYMSPEQLVDKGLDHRSDIFSIGILLYELLSGRRMYSGDTATIIRKCMQVDYEPLEKVRPGLDRAIYDILHSALQKEKEERYGSCRDMARDIGELLFAMEVRPQAHQLSEYMLDLFGKEYEQETTHLAQLRAESSDEDVPALTDYTSYERTVIESVGLTEHFGDLPDLDSTAVSGKTGMLLGRLHKMLPGWRIWATGGGLIGAVLIFSLAGPGEEEAVYYPGPTILPATEDTRFEEQISPDAQVILQELVGAQEEVTTLLDRGQKAIEDNRLTTPVNDSAWRWYRQVLQEDPDNNVARDGIRLIGEKYAELAEGALEAGKLRESEGYINKGLRVVPDSDRLLQMQGRLNREEKMKIGELEAKAMAALKANKLTTPYSESAYRYSQDIRKIERNSQAAARIVKRIGDRYAVLGEKAYSDMKFDAARVYVKKGLEVIPGHRRLLRLKKELSGSQSEVFFRGLEKKLQTIFR